MNADFKIKMVALLAADIEKTAMGLMREFKDRKIDGIKKLRDSYRSPVDAYAPEKGGMSAPYMSLKDAKDLFEAALEAIETPNTVYTARAMVAFRSIALFVAERIFEAQTPLPNSPSLGDILGTAAAKKGDEKEQYVLIPASGDRILDHYIAPTRAEAIRVNRWNTTIFSGSGSGSIYKLCE